MGETHVQMKANTEALKEQMSTMMKAMISIKEIMEVNAVVIAATSTIVEVDLTPPYGVNQINHPTPDMVGLEGKELGGPGGPHLVQMKADTEALKEQMSTMMDAMMSIKEIIEVNAVVIAATITIVEVDLPPQ